MSSPMEKIKHAKEMLDAGYITAEQFEQIRKNVLSDMGLNFDGPAQVAAPSMVGETSVGGPSLFAQSTTPTPAGPSSGPSLSSALTGGATLIDSPNSPVEPTHLEPAQDTPMRIGNFNTVRKLGSGGMGTVYIARHRNEHLARTTGDVAIKVIHPHFAQDPMFRARFINEAGLGIKINHPNIARVYELIDTESKLGFAMELVDGDELDNRITEQGMSLEEALVYLEPLGSALDHLHHNQIAHRDFKPENVKITASNAPIILDFGIALIQNEGNARQTQEMTSMGTPMYMAPEQATDALKSGAPADLYAFGLVTYQLLSGQLPWRSDLSAQGIILAKISEELIPLHKQNPNISKSFSDAIMKMLSKKPEDRFDSCASFLQALKKGGLIDAKVVERYERILQKVLSDGIIDDHEQRNLIIVRQKLGIGEDLHHKLMKKYVGDADATVSLSLSEEQMRSAPPLRVFLKNNDAMSLTLAEILWRSLPEGRAHHLRKEEADLFTDDIYFDLPIDSRAFCTHYLEGRLHTKDFMGDSFFYKISPVPIAVNQAGLQPFNWAQSFLHSQGNGQWLFSLVESDEADWNAYQNDDLGHSQEAEAARKLSVVTITEDEAVGFAEQPIEVLDLNHLTEISPRVAQILAGGSIETLSLNGLTALDVETARQLADHTGDLYLGGIRDLPPEVAAALVSGGESIVLHLNGLSALSTELAHVFEASDIHLNLDGLHNLPIEIAKILGASEGLKLSLMGIEDIDATTVSLLENAELTLGLAEIDAQIAQALSAENVNLPKVSSISPAAARALSQDRTGFSLNGLTALSAAVAEVLSTTQAESIELNGLSSLEHVSVQSLQSLHSEAYLQFNGVRHLTTQDALALSQLNISWIDLLGLQSIDEKAVPTLAAAKASLTLSDGVSAQIEAYKEAQERIRQEEEARREAERKRIEAQKRKEEEARRQEEEARRLEEQRRRQEEARIRKEEERKRQEEARRRRAEEEKRKAEARRQKEEEERIAARKEKELKRVNKDYSAYCSASSKADYLSGRSKHRFDLWVEYAEAGHAEAAFLVGKCYDEGLIVAADQHQAISFYTRSVEHGNTKALQNLGLVYREQGRLEDAYHMLKRSAENGNFKGVWAIREMVEDALAQEAARQSVQAETAEHAPNHAPVDEPKKDQPHRIVLTSFKSKERVSVIKAVRQITGLGYSEALSLIESLPAHIKEVANQDAALNVLEALHSVGAVAEMESISANEISTATSNPTSKPCIQCSTQLRLSTRFCPSCGTRQ